MMRYVILLCLLLTIALSSTAQKEYCINDYGAKGDGVYNNSVAIQKTIDKAAISGSKVIVPKGRFMTGPIVLKSGVELYLQKGAVLLGSINRLDYGEGKADPLISAKHAANISISGDGIIDGQCAALIENEYELLQEGRIEDAEWKIKRIAEDNRPKLIFLELCNNVKITGITIKNGSGWIQEYLRCRNVRIDGITVNGTAYWNNDGIDIVNSKNVTITNCNINTSDDAICLKSEGAVLDSCVNVFIMNCKLRSSANAVKLGTTSNGGFRNVHIENIEVYDTYRSAIALEAVDGGFLENIDVHSVHALNTGNAIFIKLGHRNKDEKYSTIHNISIKDMYVEVPSGKPDKGYNMEGPLLRYPPGFTPDTNAVVQSISPWNYSAKDSTAILYQHNVFPSSITGLPNHYVKDITLENIEIVYEGDADKNKALFPWQHLEKITEAATAYPEFSMFGELPVWGLYVRHAKNITLKSVTLRYKKEDFRLPCIFDDIINLELTNLNIPASQSMPALLLNNVKGYELKGLSLPGKSNQAVLIQNHYHK